MDPDAVTVVPYDPRWPDLFEEERARIVAAPPIEVVEHVGSTAVPGLDAKPIVDIMAGVRRFADAERCVAPLRGLGYECRGEAGIPGRLFFRRFREGRRVCHLHLVEVGGGFWEDHLLFREYLRAHPDTARAYAALKRRLAERFRNDRDAYTEAKTGFIAAVIERARAESGPGERGPGP